MPASKHQSVTKIGEAVDRIDGPLKVQGKATYAGEFEFDQPTLVGVYVGASRSGGTLTHVDTADAESQPGVKAVLTYHNAPDQRPFSEPGDEGRFGQSRAVLNDTTIRYAGFPVALVVAETLEQARYAASLITHDVATDGPDFLDDVKEAQTTPESLDGGFEPDVSCGDIDHALNSSMRLDMTYRTPSQISAAMEPHTTIAYYDGDILHVHTSVQILASAVTCLANTLNMPEEKIHVQSPFVGGGFGSKLGLHNDAILACLGAIHLQQPVKVALHRRQVFHSAPHRGFSIQKIALSADNSGHINGISHHSAMPMAQDYAFAEATGAVARITYKADAIESVHRVKVVDSPMIDSCRAPGDSIGSLAFESAIDELALASETDPVTFRLNNIAPAHPITGKPFSTHHLEACLKQGAEEFGWDKRSKSEDNNTVKKGYGVALAMRMNMIVPSEAKIVLENDGKITVFTDMTDIGTGTYTILSQIVSDFFDMPASNITINLGDSRSPASCGSGGSFGASSSATSVRNACEKLSAQLCQMMGLAQGTHTVALHDNQVIAGEGNTQQSRSLADLLKETEGQQLEAKGEVEPGESHDDYEQYSCGAHFAEVTVDTVTGEVRIKRQHGVFSAGQILNKKTATSQLQGGMVWGASYALFEDLQRDRRHGGFVNCDLAEYHFAVNRDIGDISVSFIEEPDYKACKLGSKGIGELGITGAGAAIANAVCDATGARVRDFPITPDKVIAALG
ncbi:xanthine dehydrogenase family protein molybdopterin-binding subunit [Salinimonas sp. HHU 13199]|uniref:Xanthine dehydrogenase family protein molybdopterin-binding subunit n=1 Tax=Salinimonas profundi TaxID=2729140 RepID=A0ABR8LJ66_9ALTE|nr:xanthine dehydrogenase family protein molybdopterin-binding subunit [Salinimonas profundi]MBD3585623.1 xanthine dehydrogenase family protein molybdopterin-binding subunit [Salinimonas profundi]